MQCSNYHEKASRIHDELRFPTDDGIEIAAHAWGDSANPPVILLHGGGQTRHAWKNTAEAIANHGYYALAIDLRGHGDSGWSPDGVDSLSFCGVSCTRPCGVSFGWHFCKSRRLTRRLAAVPSGRHTPRKPIGYWIPYPSP